MDAEIQRPRMANYGQKLLKVMGTDSDMSSFTMSNGMHCETREKNCTVSKINPVYIPLIGTKNFFIK